MRWPRGSRPGRASVPARRAGCGAARARAGCGRPGWRRPRRPGLAPPLPGRADAAAGGGLAGARRGRLAVAAAVGAAAFAAQVEPALHELAALQPGGVQHAQRKARHFQAAFSLAHHQLALTGGPAGGRRGLQDHDPRLGQPRQRRHLLGADEPSPTAPARLHLRIGQAQHERVGALQPAFGEIGAQRLRWRRGGVGCGRHHWRHLRRHGGCPRRRCRRGRGRRRLGVHAAMQRGLHRHRQRNGRSAWPHLNPRRCRKRRPARRPCRCWCTCDRSA